MFPSSEIPQYPSRAVGLGAEFIAVCFAAEVQVDTGTAGNAIPTITVEDTSRADKKPPPKPVDTKAQPEVSESSTLPALPTSPTVLEHEVPGDMPSGAAPEIPHWYKVGWRDVSGIDLPISAGDEKHKEILGVFLNEQYYGEWYHNAAMVVVVSARMRIGVKGMMYSCLPGRTCDTFHNALQFRVRLGIHHPSVLQHLLHDFYAPYPSSGTR